jgi:Mg-chelatase subunit ChlD
MNPLSRQRPLAVVALLAAVLLGTPVPAAVAAEATDEPSRDEVYQDLGLAELPADYVILVDVSGSMGKNGRYDPVRSALRPFLESLSPEDYVALFTFGDDARAIYLGSPADPAGILARLPASITDAKVKTDIGAGLERGLTELERPDAAEIGSVVMFTDGKHLPARESVYRDVDGPAWDALAERGEALAEEHELAAYSLPLTTKEAGTEQLGEVIANTTELRPESVENLEEYLGRAAERVRARKAALLLREDEGNGVAAEWSTAGPLDLDDGPVPATLRLTATTTRVPVTVTGLAASLDGEPVTVGGLPEEVFLAAGESREFEVLVEGSLGAGPLPVRRTRETGADLTVGGSVGSPWEVVLDDQEFGLAPAVEVAEREVRLRAEVGSPLALPLLIGVPLAVLLAGWLLWLHRNRVPLRGLLLVTRALGEGPQDRVQLSGRRVALNPPMVGGSGSVHGRRHRSAAGVPGVALHIRYSPDGTADRSATAVCRPGDQIMINGVTFSHQPHGATATPVPAWTADAPAPVPGTAAAAGPWMGTAAARTPATPAAGHPPVTLPGQATGPAGGPAAGPSTGPGAGPAGGRGFGLGPYADKAAGTGPAPAPVDGGRGGFSAAPLPAPVRPPDAPAGPPEEDGSMTTQLRLPPRADTPAPDAAIPDDDDIQDTPPPGYAARRPPRQDEP